MKKTIKGLLVLFLSCIVAGCSWDSIVYQPEETDLSNLDNTITIDPDQGQDEATDLLNMNIEITVDDVLENPEIYAGETIKVRGMLPQSLIQDSNGREITAIFNDNLDAYIETKGGTPNFGGCEAYVTGNVILDNGIPIINAHSYEPIQ